MRIFSFFLFSIIFCFKLTAQKSKIIDVYCSKDTSCYLSIKSDAIFFQRWDTLAQAIFWKQIMNLSSDTAIVNIAASRKILGNILMKNWNIKTDKDKLFFKDSVRNIHNLTDSAKIYITSGRKEFYLFNNTIPSISKAIELFNSYKTDPWYAQAILLIESPGKLEYSTVGAYGSFQLMKSVALSHGLIVNKEIDERKNFDKSAKAACSLLNTICIPETKRVLSKLNIEFDENDLWFKFVVLHVYHAGIGNVEGLLGQISEDILGNNIVTWMWQNEWGNFKNASQNYTQVAIAAILCLNDIIYNNCDEIYECDIENL